MYGMSSRAPGYVASVLSTGELAQGQHRLACRRGAEFHCLARAHDCSLAM